MAATDVTPEELRPLLFSLAYRMVGERRGGGGPRAGGVPAVPRARRRWRRRRRSSPRSSRGWRSTTCAPRACGGRRTSAPWLPEPLVAVPGAAERVEDDETLSLAFLALLERLTPVERAVYVLHELFGYAHDEIADDRRQEQRELPPDPRPRAQPRRRRAAALRAVARAARGAARPLPRRRPGRRRRRRSSGCSPPTPCTTPTAAARRARRCCRSTAPTKIARLWASARHRQRPVRAAPGRRQRPARRRGLRRRTATLLVVLTLDVADDRVHDGAGGGEPGQARPGRRRRSSAG